MRLGSEWDTDEMVGWCPLFLDGVTKITRNAIPHANICNEMPLVGIEPETLTPIAHTPTNLQNDNRETQQVLQN